jgi:hypothetical protein
MERAAQIARRNNYLFLQPKHLELLMMVNMASRAKHGWSALQSVFTAPKFRALEMLLAIGNASHTREQILLREDMSVVFSNA